MLTLATTMPINITVTVTGMAELERRFASSPELVKAAQLNFLRKSRRLLLRNVRANIRVRTQQTTPPQGERVVRRTAKGKQVATKIIRVAGTKRKWYPPGTTRRSVRTSLSTARMQTTVLSRWFVTRFLERGTRRMPAQRPFQRAAEGSAGELQGFVGDMAKEIADKLEGRA